MAFNNFITGGIYSIEYSNWRHNFKIYGFMLYGSVGSPKVHILNLSAMELSTVGRIKLMRGIITMSQIQNTAVSSNGAMLYRIFKTYYPQEIKKCYRTLWNTYITRSSLINYGIHPKEYYANQPQSFVNNALLLKAQNDMIMKMYNMYSKRGVEMQAMQANLAVPKYVEKTTTNITDKKENIVEIDKSTEPTEDKNFDANANPEDKIEDNK